MKKIIIFVLVLFLLGCSKNKTANVVVIEYLNDIKNVGSNIKGEIDDALDKNDDFIKEHKTKYREILIRQYKNLKYDILKEEYDNNGAIITVNINVFDLNRAEDEALEYLKDNLNDFYDETSKFDNNKYLSYKLDLMKKTNYRIDYEIVFYLKKQNKKWIMEQPTESDLEKISGTYKETEY